MEDASRALLIAAGVFIGVMILSLGVFLFNSLNQFTESTQERMDQNAVSKFNNQFLAYVDNPSLRIQDVITVANMASENNANYGVENESDGNNYYVKVIAEIKTSKDQSSPGRVQGIEKSVVEKEADWLSFNSENKYKCEKVKMSQKTGRVYEIEFEIK